MEYNISPSEILTDTIGKLSVATTLESITTTVAAAARKLAGADGATFVLRDGDKCYYVDENAVSPLWKGKRFPAEACISGWTMIHGKIATIEDIYQDPRIPADAYRPTFVKSLCMVPICPENAIGAIGNYWASHYRPSSEQVKLLQILANSTSVALKNLDLRMALEKSSYDLSDSATKRSELETGIHSLAHDLKSPLASIIGFSEILEESVGSSLDEDARKYLSCITRIAYRSVQQIERMLALYGVTHRKLEKKKVDLSIIAQELSEQLRSQDPARTVIFTIEPALEAFADPYLARLALENLLGNAFKYSSKKPVASIQVGRFADESTQTTFFVKDNGDGFDATQAQRLFRPLVRLHQDTDFLGTGLGLVSVQRIVELHGGKVRAEGKKSEGATFFFSFPAA